MTAATESPGRRSSLQPEPGGRTLAARAALAGMTAALLLVPDEAQASDEVLARLALLALVMPPVVVVFVAARRLRLNWRLVPTLATAILAGYLWLHLPESFDTFGSILAFGLGLPLLFGLLLAWLLIRWQTQRRSD